MNQPARRRSYKKSLEAQQSSSPPSSSTANAPTSSSSSKNKGKMDTAHRKIELQSSEDFTYLINNVRRAATDSINAAFPLDDASEDEMRVRIETLVYDYIKQTFTLAAPNLTINGMDVNPTHFLSSLSAGDPASTPQGPEEQYEAFDGRKRQRVEELAREEEDLLREIAALKRKVPAAAAASYAETFKSSIKVDEEALAAARAKVENISTEDGRKAKLIEMGPLERQADVEETFEEVVKTLGRLKRDMPATVAKMERARVAGEYVVTER